MSADLEQTANRAVSMALDAGATDAECTLAQGDEFSCFRPTGRGREPERSRVSSGAGIRILVEAAPDRPTPATSARRESAAWSTRRWRSLRSRPRIPMRGCPRPMSLGASTATSSCSSTMLRNPVRRRRSTMAKQAERAALDFDPRITNSEGAGSTLMLASALFANSRGFRFVIAVLSCSLQQSPVARTGVHGARLLVSPPGVRGPLSNRRIGRAGSGRAGALRRLGPRKMATQRPPSYSSRALRARCSVIFRCRFRQRCVSQGYVPSRQTRRTDRRTGI